MIPSTLSQNICFSNIYWSKKTIALALAVQKIDFWGGLLGSGSQIRSELYTKIRFRCFVVLEKKSVQDLGRKTGQKKGKKNTWSRPKEKNLVGMVELVGMKGYLKTYNRVKYFWRTLAVLEWDRFLRLTCGVVSGSCWNRSHETFRLEICTTIQLINLKLQLKLHVARPNHSRAISKSLRLQTR